MTNQPSKAAMPHTALTNGKRDTVGTEQLVTENTTNGTTARAALDVPARPNAKSEMK